MAEHLDAIKINYEKILFDEVQQKFMGVTSKKLNAIYESSAGLLKANKCLEAVYVCMARNFLKFTFLLFSLIFLNERKLKLFFKANIP